MRSIVQAGSVIAVFTSLGDGWIRRGIHELLGRYAGFLLLRFGALALPLSQRPRNENTPSARLPC